MKYVETNNNIWNIAIMQKLQKHLHDHVMVVTQKGVLNSVDFTKTEMGWHRTNTVRHLFMLKRVGVENRLGVVVWGLDLIHHDDIGVH